MSTSSNSNLKIKSFANKHQPEIYPEAYLNHPTFGLLTRVCLLEENLELFTTLYIQRFFFLVTTHTTGVKFVLISRTDACLRVENRLRQLRRAGQSQEYNKLFAMYQLSFR